MRELTSEEREQLAEVLHYAVRVARQYFRAGTDIGEATRGRVVEKIARNWTQRSHITHRKEVHQICRRAYADEIRHRFGNPTARDKRGHHGVWASLLDDAEEDNREVVAGFGFHVEGNDGGIDDVIARISLEQDAAAYDAQPHHQRGVYREVSSQTIAKVLQFFATAEGADTMSMQEIADEIGVSKASVSRACKYLRWRRAS